MAKASLPFTSAIGEEVLQIEELALEFDLALLVQLEEADTFEEENISALGRKTYPPFDGRELTKRSRSRVATLAGGAPS